MTYRQMQALVRRVHTVFLATTDGKQPRVRPMAAYAWFGSELWMATGVKSLKVTDVRKRPAVEVCAMGRTYTHARIEARCRTSRTAADKRKMFGAFPWMRNYFGSVADRSWFVLRLTPTRIRVMGKDLRYEEIALPSGE